MAAQQSVHIGDEPRRITELEPHAQILRYQAQERHQTVGIDPPLGRELEQDRAKFVTEDAGTSHHLFQGGAGGASSG